MNRVKYRICLLLLLVAAVAFGVFYNKFLNQEEQDIKNATFVYWVEKNHGEQAEIHIPEAVKELAG